MGLYINVPNTFNPIHVCYNIQSLCIVSGDTVVHFLTEQSRKKYELEKLWTLGHRYDDQYRELERTVFESDNLR